MNELLPSLLADVKALIDGARQRVAVAVNAELTMLYWQIGSYINANLLQNARADYGRQTVRLLAQQLTQEYGGGWAEKSLRRMMQFAEVFSDQLNCRDTVATIELVAIRTADTHRGLAQTGILR